MPQDAMTAPQPTVITVQNPPSVGIAVLLAGLFGPLGMFYSTIVGAIVMMVISAVVGFFTVGIGLLVTVPIGMIWAGFAAKSTANKMMAS